MITDAILKLLTMPVIVLIESVSVIGFTIPVGVFNGLLLLSENLGYIFPISSILPVFVLKMLLRNARIIWAMVIRVKSFIPTMGD